MADSAETATGGQQETALGDEGRELTKEEREKLKKERERQKKKENYLYERILSARFLARKTTDEAAILTPSEIKNKTMPIKNNT